MKGDAYAMVNKGVDGGLLRRFNGDGVLIA